MGGAAVTTPYRGGSPTDGSHPLPDDTRRTVIEVPADAAGVDAARIAVLTALRDRVGHDRLDALRVALDEVCELLVAGDGDAPLTCTVRSSVARTDVICDRRAVTPVAPPLVRRLLDSLVDTVEEDRRPDGVRWVLTLHTQSGPIAPPRRGSGPPEREPTP
ncbi:MAG: hypothetical protein ACLGIR_09950 [Actinomycetes bacterium]